MASSPRLLLVSTRSVLSLVCSLGIVALVLGFAPGVQAAPKPTVASVTAELSTLARQNERLSEAYNKAGIDVAAKQKQADEAAAASTKARTAYLASRSQVRLDTIEQYKGGGFASTAALLTSHSSQDYLDQLSTLSLMSSRRVTITDHLKAQKVAATKAAETARSLFAQASKNRTALSAARADLKARVARYTQLLSRLNAAERARLLVIAQAKIKAIAQAPVTKAQRKAQVKVGTTTMTRSTTTTTTTATPTATPKAKSNNNNNNNGNSKSKSNNNSKSKKSGPKGPPPGASGGAAVAVRFALAQIGKPYVFAAAGPNAYDCSGLTMAAWARAGVQLPHFAAAQYQMGHHVDKSQLEPGDLVFFYSGIGHVGMYIGNGLIVHAPHTGDVVRIAPLSQFGGAYIGATRLA